MPGVDIVYPVEANAVFVRMPRDAIKRIQDEAFFYVWDESENVVRLMLSFDSTSEDVERMTGLFAEHCRM
jgi:threonine aldolase